MKDYNKVSVFLYPLLGIPMNIFKTSNGFNRFINAYLYDEDIKEFRDRHIFILVNNYQDKDFNNFEKTISNSKNFVTDYDILEGKYSIKVFKIPEEFEFEYDMFLKNISMPKILGFSTRILNLD
jgi:hypothetical protein